LLASTAKQECWWWNLLSQLNLNIHAENTAKIPTENELRCKRECCTDCVGLCTASAASSNQQHAAEGCSSSLSKGTQHYLITSAASCSHTVSNIHKQPNCLPTPCPEPGSHKSHLLSSKTCGEQRHKPPPKLPSQPPQLHMTHSQAQPSTQNSAGTHERRTDIKGLEIPLT